MEKKWERLENTVKTKRKHPDVKILTLRFPLWLVLEQLKD